MIRKLTYLLLTLLFYCHCCATTFLPEESSVIDKFLRIMCEKSETGFVFLGDKPVCIHGYYLEDSFSQANECHQFSITLKEAVTKWKQVQQTQESQNIIIHFYDKPDTSTKNIINLLFINKSLFLKTVQENLALFQYILGPQVTPTALLNQLISADNIDTVLKSNRVLAGILLGFGTQNALYFSRYEYLLDGLFQEFPPFKSRVAALEQVQAEYYDLVLYNAAPIIDFKKPIKPSFGYSSLKEETDDILAKIVASSEKLENESPPFVYGRLQNAENEKIAVHLEHSQLKIRNFVKEEHFLEKVLALIYPQASFQCAAPASHLSFTLEERAQLAYLVAYTIWQELTEEDPNYITVLLQGLQDCHQGQPLSKEVVNTHDYQRIRALRKLSANLTSTKDFFDRLAQDKTYTALVPSKLYYKTIKAGQGAALTDQQLVTLHYTIKLPNQSLLVDTMARGVPVETDLSEMIPGLSHGLKGMQKGEIRQLLIHPSLAYGIHTTLDKGVYLNCQVQLVDYDANQPLKKLPALTPLDLSIALSSDLELEYNAQTKKVGYLTGYKLWEHFKKDPSYQFNQVLGHLKGLQDQPTKPKELSAQQSKLLNRLHWNIYYQPS